MNAIATPARRWRLRCGGSSTWMLPMMPIYLAMIDPAPELVGAVARTAAMLAIALAAWAGIPAVTRPLGRSFVAVWAGAWVLTAGSLYALIVPTRPFVALQVGAAALAIGASLAVWSLRTPGSSRFACTWIPRTPRGQGLVAGTWLVTGGIVLGLTSAPPAIWVDGGTILAAIVLQLWFGRPTPPAPAERAEVDHG